MARVKLKFPIDNPLLISRINVRISDINYGGHVGNDSILSIIHESRMQMLQNFGGNEMNICDNSLIMADVMIAYKAETYYGDILIINIYAEEFTQVSFDLLYHISTMRNGQTTDVAHAKTGMVCFDYEARKVANMTAGLREILSRTTITQNN
jgi:acyl-CoA thioesterase FadM